MLAHTYVPGETLSVTKFSKSLRWAPAVGHRKAQTLKHRKQQRLTAGNLSLHWVRSGLGDNGLTGQLDVLGALHVELPTD